MGQGGSKKKAIDHQAIINQYDEDGNPLPKVPFKLAHDMGEQGWDGLSPDRSLRIVLCYNTFHDHYTHLFLEHLTSQGSDVPLEEKRWHLCENQLLYKYSWSWLF